MYIPYLEPVTARLLFVLEDFWGVESCHRGTVPGGEKLFVLTDDVHQIVEGLGMNLHVRNKHHLRRLESTDDLLFQWFCGAELSDDVIAEHDVLIY